MESYGWITGTDAETLRRAGGWQIRCETTRMIAISVRVQVYVIQNEWIVAGAYKCLLKVHLCG